MNTNVIHGGETSIEIMEVANNNDTPISMATRIHHVNIEVTFKVTALSASVL